MVSILGIFIAVACGADPLEQRIVHNDPTSYQLLSGVHGGAGKMKYRELLGSSALRTNFLFLHAGVILPQGGIGHHFHHDMEEMYVLLEGEAEFTINGRTSRLKGPVVVPCKMGQSHGLYNPTDKPIRWLNFAVSSEKGKGDSFDLADDRVGASLDSRPVFVSARLDRDGLPAKEKFHGGDGTVYYHRVLPSGVFRTSWSYVDHLVIPPGTSTGLHKLVDLEEVYYVISGTGVIRVNGRQTMIRQGDAFPMHCLEVQSFTNRGNQDLELLAIGITNENVTGENNNGQTMLLEIYFKVSEKQAADFEKMYAQSYVSALKKQQGYLRSNLLRLFPENTAKEIGAAPTEFNYQMQLVFDTEENRRQWVASKEHNQVWPLASGMAEKFAWRGFDVVREDQK